MTIVEIGDGHAVVGHGRVESVIRRMDRDGHSALETRARVGRTRALAGDGVQEDIPLHVRRPDASLRLAAAVAAVATGAGDDAGRDLGFVVADRRGNLAFCGAFAGEIELLAALLLWREIAGRVRGGNDRERREERSAKGEKSQ